MAKNKNDFVSDKRLYLDADGNVVGEHAPTRVSLLVAAGGSLPREVAEKYNLTRPLVEDAAAELSEFAPVEGEGEGVEDDEAKAPTKRKAAKAPARHK